MSMSEVKFWELIDESSKDVADQDEQEEKLLKLLEKLSESEIIGFQENFDEAIRNAYRYDLWGAAYIVNGGCSNDGFHYFCCWLIAQGEKFYKAVLGDPSKVGERVVPGGDEAEFELIAYVASTAWEKLTGEDDLYDHTRRLPIPTKPQGKRWEEDDLEKLFPELAAKFWD